MANTVVRVAPSSVSGVDSSALYTLGSQIQEAGNWYRYVYNAGNSQISPGYGACMTNVSGWSVTVSSVTGANVLVGVVKHATLTTGTYGWLLTNGFTTVRAGNSLTSGHMLVLSTDGEFIHKSISTGHTAPVIGQVLQGDTATAGTAFALVKAFGG